MGKVRFEPYYVDLVQTAWSVPRAIYFPLSTNKALHQRMSAFCPSNRYWSKKEKPQKPTNRSFCGAQLYSWFWV